MTTKAYLLGVNTKGLEYAEQDADALERALRRYDYQTVRLQADKTSILAVLDDMVDRHGTNDQVIFIIPVTACWRAACCICC